MRDTSTNLPNLKAAQEAWRKRNLGARETFKLHEFIGALSCYCPAANWDRALNTTFGYIKSVEEAKL